MICQVNGEGYGLYKNVERHWISQILRNLREHHSLTCKRCGGGEMSGGTLSPGKRREQRRGGMGVFENVPPLIFLLIDY